MNFMSATRSPNPSKHQDCALLQFMGQTQRKKPKPLTQCCVDDKCVVRNSCSANTHPTHLAFERTSKGFDTVLNRPWRCTLRPADVHQPDIQLQRVLARQVVMLEQQQQQQHARVVPFARPGP